MLVYMSGADLSVPSDNVDLCRQRSYAEIEMKRSVRLPVDGRSCYAGCARHLLESGQDTHVKLSMVPQGGQSAKPKGHGSTSQRSRWFA